jgi:dCTP diphosphatase
MHDDHCGMSNGVWPLDSLTEIAGRLRAFRHARDWGQYHSPKNLAISVAIEAGELLEHFQWRSDADIEEYLTTDKEGVAEELADVAIYVIQLAEVAGIALPDAIHAKIAQNDSRYAVEFARGNYHKQPSLDQRGAGDNGCTARSSHGGSKADIAR